MRKLTIKEVIKAIPLQEDMKRKLLSEYDTYDEATKFEVIHTCWNAFDAMRNILTDAKSQEFEAEVAAGRRKFGPDFTDEIEEAVWKEIDEYITGKKHEAEAIEQVRSQLQSLISRSHT